MNTEILCLATLMRHPASGYDIRKMYEDGPFKLIKGISFGSIYPALSRLLDQGYVQLSGGHPTSSRDAKVYEITEKGRSFFVERLYTPPRPDEIRSDFLFVLAFGDQLSREWLNRVMDMYVESIKGQQKLLASFREELGCDLNRFESLALGMGEAITQAKIEYLQRNRHRLFDADEAISHPAGTPETAHKSATVPSDRPTPASKTEKAKA